VSRALTMSYERGLMPRLCLTGNSDRSAACLPAAIRPRLFAAKGVCCLPIRLNPFQLQACLRAASST
jgi:hypothetical protein